MADTVWTIGALVRWTAEFLAKKNVESPRLDAEVLLAHVLGCRRIELYTRSEELAGDEARGRFRELIRRRVEGCPVAYLVGVKEFYLRSFGLTPAVLIPRPETETLVLAALERLKPRAAPRILDLGTGSGCIAVSLALHMKSAQIVATDVSDEALEIARRNAARHGVADRIAFRSGDLFEPATGDTFDAIVSNPPYIPADEIAKLAPEVREHEPRAALDGGPDGLAVIGRLISGATSHLKPGGWLIFEIGAGQESSVQQLLHESHGLLPEKTVFDAIGIPRVAVANRKAS